jgi:hypothetical protein
MNTRVYLAQRRKGAKNITFTLHALKLGVFAPLRETKSRTGEVR